MDSRLQVKLIEEDNRLNETVNTLNEENAAKERRLKLYRFIFLTFVLVGLFFNTIYGFAMISGNVSCIEDSSFNLTKPINDYFNREHEAKNKIIIASSLYVDLMVVIFAIIWAAKGTSWRPIVSLIIFFCIRLLAQSIFQIKTPEGYAWENPGFPSLIVPYVKTNSLFFSGHIGVPIIAGFEFNRMGYNFACVVCLLSSIFEGFVLIVLRAHYIIDIFAGIIFAHYTFLFTEKYLYVIDESCLSMKNKNEELENNKYENIL